MKAQEIKRNMKRDFIWILVVLALIGLLGLPSISLAVEDTWTTKADMPTGRMSLSTSTVNRKIYVGGAPMGVRGGRQSSVSTVEEYDPATDTWTTKAAMPKGKFDFSTSAVDGKIYAIGGSLASYPWAPDPTVEEYDTGFDPPITSIDATGKLTTTWGKIK